MRKFLKLKVDLAAERGFSSIEILVVITIVTILSFIAMPNVKAMLESFNKRDAEVQVLQDIRLAQATTVEQGCQGVMVVADDGESYSYGCDYVPYSEASPPEWDSVRWSRTLPSNVRISASDVILFNSRGQVIDEGGALTTATINLSVVEHGGQTLFNTGTLRPTGFFSFNG